MDSSNEEKLEEEKFIKLTLLIVGESCILSQNPNLRIYMVLQNPDMGFAEHVGSQQSEDENRRQVEGRHGYDGRVFIPKMDMCQDFKVNQQGEGERKHSLHRSSIWHLAPFTVQHYNQVLVVLTCKSTCTDRWCV